MDKNTDFSEIFQSHHIDNQEFSNITKMYSGQYSVLYKAQRAGKWCVLKTLKAEFREVLFYQQLLQKEFNLLHSLDFPYVVSAYEYVEHTDFGGCIVMEYVDGRTWDQFLAEKPTRRQCVKAASELLDVLRYLHGKQIVHKDLKPANILITWNGNFVKVVDLGLADSDAYAILKLKAGTVGYAAPEQIGEKGKIDCRADLFALGKLFSHPCFPLRYRIVAKRCQQKEVAGRPADVQAVDALLKKLRVAFVCVCVTVVSAVLIFIVFCFSHRFSATEHVPDTATGTPSSYSVVANADTVSFKAHSLSKIISPISAPTLTRESGARSDTVSFKAPSLLKIISPISAPTLTMESGAKSDIVSTISIDESHLLAKQIRQALKDSLQHFKQRFPIADITSKETIVGWYQAFANTFSWTGTVGPMGNLPQDLQGRLELAPNEESLFLVLYEKNYKFFYDEQVKPLYEQAQQAAIAVAKRLDEEAAARIRKSKNRIDNP